MPIDKHKETCYYTVLQEVNIMKKQSAGELSRTIAGQWSKSQKREKAAREITEMKKKTHQINKQFKNRLQLNRD